MGKFGQKLKDDYSMERTKKLQNYFKDFLPLNYKEFRRLVPEMTSNQSVVAELLVFVVKTMT